MIDQTISPISAEHIEDLRRRVIDGSLDAWPDLYRACKRAGVEAFGAKDHYIDSIVMAGRGAIDKAICDIFPVAYDQGAWWIDITTSLHKDRVAAIMEPAKGRLRIEYEGPVLGYEWLTTIKGYITDEAKLPLVRLLIEDRSRHIEMIGCNWLRDTNAVAMSKGTYEPA